MKKRRWLWEVYFVYFAAVTLNQALNIFLSSTTIYRFYHILMAFDRWLGILYYVRIVCELIHALSLIPLFLFIFRLQWLDQNFWKWLIALRIGFDLVGHYYEYITIKSLFFSKPWMAMQLSVWLFLTILPFYYACLKYAFGKADKKE